MLTSSCYQILRSSLSSPNQQNSFFWRNGYFFQKSFCISVWKQIVFHGAIPDICHKHHKQCLWRKLLSCGEIFPYDRLSCREVSPHEKCEENLSHRESSPHDKCGAKCIMWRNVEKSVMWINVST